MAREKLLIVEGLVESRAGRFGEPARWDHGARQVTFSDGTTAMYDEIELEYDPTYPVEETDDAARDATSSGAAPIRAEQRLAYAVAGDPVVAVLADRRINVYRGKLADELVAELTAQGVGRATADANG